MGVIRTDLLKHSESQQRRIKAKERREAEEARLLRQNGISTKAPRKFLTRSKKSQLWFDRVFGKNGGSNAARSSPSSSPGLVVTANETARSSTARSRSRSRSAPRQDDLPNLEDHPDLPPPPRPLPYLPERAQSARSSRHELWEEATQGLSTHFTYAAARTKDNTHPSPAAVDLGVDCIIRCLCTGENRTHYVDGFSAGRKRTSHLAIASYVTLSAVSRLAYQACSICRISHLVRARLWPATPSKPSLIFAWEVLDLYESLAGVAGLPVREYWGALLRAHLRSDRRSTGTLELVSHESRAAFGFSGDHC